MSDTARSFLHAGLPWERIDVERTRFWSRVGHWFKAANHPDGDGGGPGGIAELESASPRLRQAVKGVEQLQDPPVPQAGQVEMERERLDEAYLRILDLIVSIRQHLELQDQRAERMAPTVDRLAEGLANIPEAARTQVELLSGITKHLESDADSAKRIEGLLSQLPHLADAQREAMVSVARQLDLAMEISGKQTGVLEEFGGALSHLGNLATESTAALGKLYAESTAKEERVARLITVQTRRLTLFCVAAIAVAATGVVLGLIAIRG